MWRFFQRVSRFGACIVVSMACGWATADSPVRVFAAASLQEVLSDLAAEFTRKTGHRVSLAFGASVTLVRQADQGAPIDLLITADAQSLTHLKRVRPVAQASLASNRLALVAPLGSAPLTWPIPAQSGFAETVLVRLGPGRFAIANPDTAPAGVAARAALNAVGAWSALEAKLARADNVRGALLWVARGEAPLGIVYKTDALAEPRVKVLDELPKDASTQTWAALLPEVRSKVASSAGKAFFDFVQSSEAQTYWARRGFAPR